MRRRNSFRSCVQACEILELRTVLSSSSFVNNILTITGSNAKNTITVTETDSQIVVRIDNNPQKNFLKYIPDVSIIFEIKVFSLSGNDLVTVTVTDESVRGYHIDVYVDGGKGNDVLTLIIGNGTLVGGPGNDRLKAGIGGANLYGGEGNDTLIGDDGGDALSGDQGNDFLVGNGAGDYLFGAQGNDSIIGGSGDDALFGGSGNDRLFGNDGNDSLWDFDGKNLLDGGSGDDRFLVLSVTNTILGGSGDDMITLGYFAPYGLIDGGSGNDTLSSPIVNLNGNEVFAFRVFDQASIINMEIGVTYL
ncbi:MAG: calcium-binding protein [Candidatus Pacebacteria bacterium]|nr:calcium-binding protein [Candidatus Paceibacterota bacterium]